MKSNFQKGNGLIASLEHIVQFHGIMAQLKIVLKGVMFQKSAMINVLNIMLKGTEF